MIKGIVFDLDHTLFDRYKTFEVISYEFYNSIKDNLLITRDEFCKLMCDADIKYNHLGWSHIDEYVRKSGGFIKPLKEKEYTEKCFGYLESYAEGFDFVDELLETLKKTYKLGLITNGTSNRQRSKIKLLDFENKFDCIYVSGEHGVEKPNVYPFEYMARQLELSPEELIYVGDHPVNDVDASRKAGYTPVWVRTIPLWHFPNIKRADYEINSVKELPDVLKNIKSEKDNV